MSVPGTSRATAATTLPARTEAPTAPPPVPTTGPRRRPGRWRQDLAAAAPGWVVAHVVVIATVLLARFLVGHLHLAAHQAHVRSHQGLLAWDADWYRRIALHGYAHVPPRSLRFFPAFPLLAWPGVVAGSAGVSTLLLLLANGGALVLGGLVHRVALEETGDEALARRAAWLVALMPPAFVMVMGYAEPLAVSLAVVALLSARRGRWWWAGAAALLYGAMRPIGLLMAVPIGVEALRHVRALDRRALLTRTAAVLAAPAGAWLYLGWVGLRFGDALLPYRAQQIKGLRGPTENPLVVLGHVVRRLSVGDLGKQLHYPWVVLAVIALVAMARRWPLSYSAFALATLAAALASYNLNSIERYLWGCFPFVLVLAEATGSGRAQVRVVMVVSTLLLAAYGLAAFLGSYVP